MVAATSANSNPIGATVVDALLLMVGDDDIGG